MATVRFNSDVALILSDVDETIADLYVRAEPAMTGELQKLLEEGKVLFLISGQGIASITRRVTDAIAPRLRKRILVGHCNGAEVWGFNESGNLKDAPYYSAYTMSEPHRKRWREIVQQVVAEFGLQVHDAMPVQEFQKKAGKNPLAVMLEDRGPQITLEVVNGYDLSPEAAAQLELKIPKTHDAYDLRIPLLERADELLVKEGIEVSPILGGVFGLDFVVRGVSKATAVRMLLENREILLQMGLPQGILSTPHRIEVWGDKFSALRGGSDRHMSEALPKEARSISFREENPQEFTKGYNIVVWNGTQHLHHGLLEFLQSR